MAKVSDLQSFDYEVIGRATVLMHSMVAEMNHHDPALGGPQWLISQGPNGIVVEWDLWEMMNAYSLGGEAGLAREVEDKRQRIWAKRAEMEESCG